MDVESNIVLVFHFENVENSNKKNGWCQCVVYSNSGVFIER